MVNDYKDYILKIASNTGFIPSTIEKVERLMKILECINTHGELGKLLALKGGTAINIAIFNFPRLSVDIDLDLNMYADKLELDIIKNKISNLLHKYLVSQGYNISDSKSKNVYALSSIVAEYTDIKDNKDNIKIEINYMLRQHILPVKQININTDVFPDKNIAVNCVNPIEIFAAKICALLNRLTARDLFDVYNLAQYNLFDENELLLLQNCFVFYYTAICGYRLEDMKLEKIDKISEYDIKTKLLPTLKNRSPQQVNVDLIQSKAKGYIESILKLTDNQILFCKKFEEGEYEANLLFDLDEILERVERHPMVLWKIYNRQ